MNVAQEIVPLYQNNANYNYKLPLSQKITTQTHNFITSQAKIIPIVSFKETKVCELWHKGQMLIG
jgi:hypothetical protein